MLLLVVVSGSSTARTVNDHDFCHIIQYIIRNPSITPDAICECQSKQCIWIVVMNGSCNTAAEIHF